MLQRTRPKRDKKNVAATGTTRATPREPATTHDYPAFFHDNEACRELLQMFSLFSNQTRFRILCVLSNGERCVHEIVHAVEGKYSNVSQQLRMLTLAGYVGKSRRQKEIVYHLEDERIGDVLRYLRRRYRMD